MHPTHPVRNASTRMKTAIRVGLAALVSVGAALVGASACLDRPICDIDCKPRTTNVFVATVHQTAVDKIDLLFMIDNSASMGDKQAVLAAAVPKLVQRLVNPNCIDPNTGAATPPPNDVNANCPAPTAREFTPIKNIHVGVITSSLGGHGAPVCPTANDQKDPLTVEEETDNAHLIATTNRFTTGKFGNPDEPPDPAGFLNWNPNQGAGDITKFNNTFTTMVTATDEHGCGYEAQLESIYRFLVDPNPPKSIALTGCPGHPDLKCAAPTGKDDAILAERQAFLRSDSLVAVIFLTDENDCSVIDSGQGFLAADATNPLPPATPECQANPNDKCCRSCRAGTPDGCQDQSAYCTSTSATFSSTGDPLNLRCWDQKRRFGFDFLYPTQRYVNALSQPTICPSRNDLDPSQCPDANNDGARDIVPNPLFAGTPQRDPALVFLAGIVGVPWQDIATSADPNQPLHYKTAKDMADPSDSTWKTIIGEPQPKDGTAPIPPIDQLMLESNRPRSGNNGQGAPLLPPNTPNVDLTKSPNGHEWNDLGGSDLEYACIFPLPKPSDCSQATTRHCDCNFFKDGDNGPLCQDPQTGAYGLTQFYAKAYPDIRELTVLRDFGNNSIVASICARNLKDANAQDYGYNPAVDAIVERLKEALNNKCLPLTLTPVPNPDKPGQFKTPCSVVEATLRTAANQNCDTNRGRTPADPRVVGPAQDELRNEGYCDGNTGHPCSDFFFCDLQEIGGDVCHKSGLVPGPNDIGWCYVDPAVNPNDDPALVQKCPPSEKRILNFVDPAQKTPAPGSTVLIACFGAQTDTPTVTPAGGQNTTPPAGDGG